MREIDLHKLGADARFNRFHATLLFWCALVSLVEGYDIIVASAAMPAIMKHMDVGATSAGFMLSSAILGMACGSLLFGTVGDHIGRRHAIAICVSLFSVFTVLTSFTNDPITFCIVRFIAGLGLGGALPCMVALLTEYSPTRLRSRMVTLMFVGFPRGAVIAAEMGQSVLTDRGWQVMFLAATVPLLLVPLILIRLPESMQFLLRAGRIDELKKIVSRLDPTFHPRPDDRFFLPAEDRVDGTPIRHLFLGGRGFSTVMLWLAMFMCLLIGYANASWLTKLMISAGHDVPTALHLLVVLQIGIIIGTIGGGWLCDRLPIRKVLLAFFALAVVSVGSLGFALPDWLLSVLIATAGAATVGTQFLLYAYAAQFYPAAVRSTGIGWAVGIGRVGGVAGPIIFGAWIAMDPPLPYIFMAMAVPAAIAFVAIALIDRRWDVSPDRDRA